MERQAELRILRRVAAQDPEIGALIEGKIVDSPIDPEIFKLKQVRNFVELIGTGGRTFPLQHILKSYYLFYSLEIRRRTESKTRRIVRVF